jgi:hypothetical protein
MALRAVASLRGCPHAIPAMQEEGALIAGLEFAAK